MAMYRVKVGSHCVAGRICNVGDVFEVKNDNLAKHPDYANFIERVFPDEVEKDEKGDAGIGKHQDKIDSAADADADGAPIIDEGKTVADIPKMTRGRPKKSNDAMETM